MDLIAVFRPRSRFFVPLIILPLFTYLLVSRYRLSASSPLTVHSLVAKDDVWPSAELSAQRQSHLRRVSVDALRSQGAKSHLKENLREDKDYVLVMVGAGWNNQLFQIVNLIHLGVLSNRIPILAPFRLVHGEEPESIAVSDVFDLHYLSAMLDDMPLVELHELKHTFGIRPRLQTIVYDGEVPQWTPDGRSLVKGDLLPEEPSVREELGCWSTTESRGERSGMSADGLMDVETPWTPVPRSCYNWADDPGRPSYPHVADLIRGRDHQAIPDESATIIADYDLPVPSLPPDQHVACLDSTFGFADQVTRYDVGSEYRLGLGSWARVARHMRFKKEIQEVANGYLRKILGVKAGKPVPNYVAVHIRRDDFSQAWLDLTPRQYAHATSQVFHTLYNQLGVEVKHVIATSDETDPAWIGQLESYGWHFVNHTQFGTVEKYGDWFPIILDSVILSSGKGFLGVVYSTMSLLAYRRTIEWNSGVGRMIEPDHVVPDYWQWPWHVV